MSALAARSNPAAPLVSYLGKVTASSRRWDRTAMDPGFPCRFRVVVVRRAAMPRIVSCAQTQTAREDDLARRFISRELRNVLPGT
jgi:hypothetical protein